MHGWKAMKLAPPVPPVLVPPVPPALVPPLPPPPVPAGPPLVPPSPGMMLLLLPLQPMVTVADRRIPRDRRVRQFIAAPLLWREDLLGHPDDAGHGGSVVRRVVDLAKVRKEAGRRKM